MNWGIQKSTNGTQTALGNFLAIKKAAFINDRMTHLITLSCFSESCLITSIRAQDIVVPFLGQTVRVHLHRDDNNKHGDRQVTVTGVSGKVLSIRLPSATLNELWRLFPFSRYTKLEGFWEKSNNRLLIYDVLRRDGVFSSGRFIDRQHHLPITQQTSSVVCLRSLTSLTSVYETAKREEGNPEFKGFLIRTGNCDLKSGTRIVMPSFYQ